jgi:hypothetical protein
MPIFKSGQILGVQLIEFYWKILLLWQIALHNYHMAGLIKKTFLSSFVGR